MKLRYTSLQGTLLIVLLIGIQKVQSIENILICTDLCKCSKLRLGAGSSEGNIKIKCGSEDRKISSLEGLMFDGVFSSVVQM